MMKSVGLLEKIKNKIIINVRKSVRTLLGRLVCVDYCCARREYKKPCCDKRKGTSMKMCWTILCSQSQTNRHSSRICVKLRRVSISLITVFRNRTGLTIFKRCLNRITRIKILKMIFFVVVESDRPITREEVLLVIQWLKNGKTEGPDGIISELFKHAGHLAVDLIIIIRNTYIAPYPTRQAQSTSQFKIRMNVRINTWTCIHQTIQRQQQSAGKHAHNPEQSVQPKLLGVK